MEKTAIQVLSEESGLGIETIEQSYSWAVRAMETFAQQRPALSKEKVLEILKDSITCDFKKTCWDSCKDGCQSKLKTAEAICSLALHECENSQLNLIIKQTEELKSSPSPQALEKAKECLESARIKLCTKESLTEDEIEFVHESVEEALTLLSQEKTTEQTPQVCEHPDNECMEDRDGYKYCKKCNHYVNE